LPCRYWKLSSGHLIVIIGKVKELVIGWLCELSTVSEFICHDRRYNISVSSRWQVPVDDLNYPYHDESLLSDGGSANS
jgi:hypothetical protein